MKASQLILTASIALTAFTSSARAQITFVNSVEGTEFNNWRTATTIKNLDIDNDNVYGTLGAINWRAGGDTSESFHLQPTGSNVLGFANVSTTTLGQFAQAEYATLDSLIGPGDVVAGINAVQYPGFYTFELTGTAADYLGKTVRVGIGADVLGVGEQGSDFSKTFRITGPANADSGVVSLRNGGAGDGVPEFYFFDITGVNPGDQFTVTAGNGPNQAGYIGPVAFDIVPEPGSTLLGIFGAVGAFGSLRRRRA